MVLRRLGDILLSANMIDKDKLSLGLKLQKESGDRLGTTLIKHKLITEEQLISALTTQLGIDFIDLSSVNIPIELAQLVPPAIAKKYQIVPVKLQDNDIYIAMADPLNFYAIEEVKGYTNKQVIPMLSNESSINDCLHILYGNEDVSRAIQEIKTELKDSGLSDNDVIDDKPKVVIDSTNSVPSIRLVNSILERAIVERASDIHFEPNDKELVIRMRIDGVMRHIMVIPRDVQSVILSRVKILSGIDISEKRLPQDGRFTIELDSKEYDVRVSTLPISYGEKIVLRILSKDMGKISKDEIGLRGDDIDKYDDIMGLKNGVVLVVGPTGSGKTTTMYAMINQLNTVEVNMITLEDPIEYNVNGVNQVQINEKIGLTFANGLRSILRQDPDIIAVGEIRDGDTANIAMRSAITGHIVLSTIHTNDAVGAIERLMDIGVEPYMISGAIRGIISQRLVRKICPYCKVKQDDFDIKQRVKWGKKIRGDIYKGIGCNKCGGSGYIGRIGIFEILKIDNRIRDIVYSGYSRVKLEDALMHSDNYRSILDSGIDLINEGITTIEEVIRVVQQ